MVIAAGQVNDVRLYRDLVASGIHDYLLKPLNADMLRDAFAQAQALINAPRTIDAVVEKPHCSVAIVGTRGGAGASTIAASLAWLISEKEKRTTALLDLDVHFGTGALALDLEPGRGLTDAIDNPSRIDGLFIERAMVRAGERLSVLSAEAPIHAPIITDGSAFYQLQEEMRTAFECTIVDLPRAMLIQHPPLVSDVRTAVIVTELTLAAARDTIRLLSWFKSNAAGVTLLVVANRVQPATNSEITRKDFEGSIERRIDHVVPFDGKLAAQSAKLGKPIVEVGKTSKTIAPIVALASALAAAVADCGIDGAKTSRGRSLMGKFGELRGLMTKRTLKPAKAK